MPVRLADVPEGVRTGEAVFWLGTAESGAAYLAQLRKHQEATVFVLGPAGDGGYWLIGLKRRPRIVGPFDNVRWSSRHALGDTLANLEGHRIALADTLDDIDDAAGLERSARFIGRVVHPA